MDNKPTDGPDPTKDDWDWEEFLRWKAKLDALNSETGPDSKKSPIHKFRRKR